MHSETRISLAWAMIGALLSILLNMTPGSHTSRIASVPTRGATVAKRSSSLVRTCALPCTAAMLAHSPATAHRVKHTDSMGNYMWLQFLKRMETYVSWPVHSVAWFSSASLTHACAMVLRSQLTGRSDLAECQHPPLSRCSPSYGRLIIGIRAPDRRQCSAGLRRHSAPHLASYCALAGACASCIVSAPPVLFQCKKSKPPLLP